MTGFVYLVLVAAANWVLRLTFIALLPVDRLPARVTAALSCTPPAVLAALVASGTFQDVPADSAAARVFAGACLAATAAVAAWRPSAALSSAMGLASALIIDLIRVR
jgi:branched-subunit amino acid transport protein